MEKQNKIDLAIEALNQAILLKLDNASFYQKRAKLWNKTDNFLKALEDIEQAIRLKPNEADFYETRSELYEKNGKIELAIKSLEKAMELSKSSLRKNIFEYDLNRLKLKIKSSNE